MDILKKNYLFDKSNFWNHNYVTYRRLWLDACLNAFSNEMRGRVVDLGGKRENKRGSFLPPENQAQVWWYVNLDLETNPNVFADVTRVPFGNQTVDCVICTEVLEHLSDPQACVDEIHRLLPYGGVVLASAPFLYPVHADPHDFQRFTDDGLRLLFRNFEVVKVHRMGGYAGVLGLMVELGIAGVEGNSLSSKFMRWAMKWISRWLFRQDLLNINTESLSWQKFSTGYFVEAIR